MNNDLFATLGCNCWSKMQDISTRRALRYCVKGLLFSLYFFLKASSGILSDVLCARGGLMYINLHHLMLLQTYSQGHRLGTFM